MALKMVETYVIVQGWTRALQDIPDALETRNAAKFWLGIRRVIVVIAVQITVQAVLTYAQGCFSLAWRGWPP